MVLLIFCLVFRSIKLALICFIPNLFPILLTFGVMGLLGIPLNVGTVTVGVVILGLAVDDTIHFMYFFKRTGSVKKSLEHVSSAVSLTSLLLILGFSSLLLANLKPTQNFGLLVAVGIFGAWIADILLLPALLNRFNSKPNTWQSKLENLHEGHRWTYGVGESLESFQAMRHLAHLISP